MRRLAWLTAAAAATVVALALAEGIVEVVAFELIVVGLVAAVFLAVGPLRPARVIERPPLTASVAPATRPPQLQRLEWMVEFATTASADAELRLIPELRDLAAICLQQGHGIDLVTDRDAAATLLGPEAWAYLDPDRRRRLGRSSLSTAEVNTIVSAIEGL